MSVSLVLTLSGKRRGGSGSRRRSANGTVFFSATHNLPYWPVKKCKTNDKPKRLRGDENKTIKTTAHDAIRLIQ